MKTFALITLIVIMITAQHLLNWVWRWDYKNSCESNKGIMSFLLSIVAIAITFTCGYYFLKWYNI